MKYEEGAAIGLLMRSMNRKQHMDFLREVCRGSSNWISYEKYEVGAAIRFLMRNLKREQHMDYFMRSMKSEQQ